MKLLWTLSALLAVVSAEDSQTTSNSNQVSSEQYYNKFTVCDDSPIIVEDIEMLCDSPGTYYYGSGKYRNSADCQAGDKGKIKITFQLTEDLQSAPYFTLSVHGYGTVPGETFYSNEQLCSISSLSTLNNQVTCPGKGWYTVSRTFHWGDQNDSYEYSFVPKVTVGFTSNPQKGLYDMGGANTNLCSGDTFTNWTKGVRRSAANTIKTFLATFGILLGAIAAVFGAGYFLMKLSRNKPKEVLIEDPLDENVNHKIALVGDNKNNLVDF